MEELKLKEDILKQLNVRKTAIMSANVLAQMAKREMNFFVLDQLKELGLDTAKQYNVDDKTGIISEVKEEPIQVENDSKESGESKAETCEEKDN